MIRDDLARGLIRIGEQAIVREDDAAIDAYFARDFVLCWPKSTSVRSSAIVAAGVLAQPRGRTAE